MANPGEMTIDLRTFYRELLDDPDRLQRLVGACADATSNPQFAEHLRSEAYLQALREAMEVELLAEPERASPRAAGTRGPWRGPLR